MTSLKKAIIALVIYLGLIFSLEYIQPGGASLVTFDWLVYTLLVAAVLSVLAIPFFKKKPFYLPMAIWLGVYIAAGLIRVKDWSTLNSIDTYFSLTEVVILEAGVWLAHLVMTRIHALERSVENVTIPQLGQRVLEMNQAMDDVRTELIRSRRHNRPLSVMVVEPVSGTIRDSLQRSVQEIQENMVTQYLVASLAHLISQEARRTDLVIRKSKDGRFVLLCPETTADGSMTLASRIRAIAAQKLGVEISTGIASFPDQALTFEELLKRAEFEMLNPAPLMMPHLNKIEKTDQK
jgi:GGDEF domain-containing protein